MMVIDLIRMFQEDLYKLLICTNELMSKILSLKIPEF